MRSKSFVILAAVLAAGFVGQAVTASAQLRVGAAKVEMTPDAKNLPSPFLSVHDPLYVRAIVIDNGKSRALLMNLDLGKVSGGLYKKFSEQIVTRFGISADNIVMAAVHDHASVPELGASGPGGPQMPTDPAVPLFIARVEKSILTAVEQAQAALQPAEVGFGEGQLYLNVNRDGIDAKTRQWAETPNYDFPSDKTLAVMVFRKPNGGEPIAVFSNYAMHSVTMFLRREISGDFPEVAEQFVEKALGGKVVSVWTSGAAGDQDPIYRRAILEIGVLQMKAEADPDNPQDRGAMIRLFAGGAKRPPAQVDPVLMEQSWQVAQALGVIMAEETIRVMGEISHYTSKAEIEGGSQEVSCPARKRLPDGSYEDAAPLSIRAGALRIGDVAIGRTDSELYNKIGIEAKAGSPFRHTLMVNLANGGGGYIPTDDAFGRGSFQVAGNRLKPGCAEPGVVKAIDGLLYKFLESEQK